MSLERNFQIASLHRPSRVGRFNFLVVVAWLAAMIATIAPAAAGATAWLIAANVVLAVTLGMVGYAIYSFVAGPGGRKGIIGPVSQVQNGQLVNTKASNAPLRVIYGIFKVGGNWVFARTSPANVNIFNFVVTWGEGEVTSLAPAIDFTPLFSGSGINDLHTGGVFSYVGCSCDSACYGYTACSCDMTTY